MTFSENLDDAGNRRGQDVSEIIARILYLMGPPAIVIVALVIVAALAIRSDVWQAFRGFTAFFIPIVLGSYILRRWPEWLSRNINADAKALTLVVPFVVVLLIGGALTGSFSVTKWILGLAFLGLLIAVLFIVRIVDERTPRVLASSMNLAVLDIIVGTVTAAGLLVLFRV